MNVLDVINPQLLSDEILTNKVQKRRYLIRFTKRYLVTKNYCTDGMKFSRLISNLCHHHTIQHHSRKSIHWSEVYIDQTCNVVVPEQSAY